jgi:hypothetical protein
MQDLKYDLLQVANRTSENPADVPPASGIANFDRKVSFQKSYKHVVYRYTDDQPDNKECDNRRNYGHIRASS